MSRSYHDSSGGVGGRSHRERLSESQRQELRHMRKRQKTEHRKRKIIKLDDEGVSKGNHQLQGSQKKNSLKTDKYDYNPYIVRMTL